MNQPSFKDYITEEQLKKLRGGKMTLTEKWKKGELKRSWYYVLLFSNEEYITFIDGNWVVDDRLIGDDIKEVLAPVPSYEEWKTVFNCANKYEVEYVECVNDYEELKKENRQLKELFYSLKCCLTSENIEPQIRIDKSLGKIDEVLK